MDRQPHIVLQRQPRPERARLRAGGNKAPKIAKRARIVLIGSDGHGGMAILRKAGVSKPAVWRWPEVFVEADVEGLVRGRGKPPGKKPSSAAINREIVAKTWKERPANATPWSVPTMPRRLASAARACNGSGPNWAQAASGEEIQGLQRPRFRHKAEDIARLYRDLPEKALGLSIAIPRLRSASLGFG